MELHSQVERSAIRKVCFRLVPFIALMFFINFLDRTAISFAGPNGLTQAGVPLEVCARQPRVTRLQIALELSQHGSSIGGRTELDLGHLVPPVSGLPLGLYFSRREAGFVKPRPLLFLSPCSGR